MNDRLPQLQPLPKRLSLLEAIVVLLVFGICITSSVVVMSSQHLSRGWQITDWRMQRIEQLLQMHLAAFGRLPCPSDISRLEGDPLYGVEATGPGRCTGQQPSANGVDSSGQRVVGGIPFATLGLNEEASKDGWGNRIVYAVSAGWTAEDAAITQQGGQGFQLRDVSEQIIEEQAGVVLWSAGSDGHGAYPSDGGLARQHAFLTSPFQLENCNCDADGRSTGVNSLFYVRATLPDSSSSATLLDDVVHGISMTTLQRVVTGDIR